MIACSGANAIRCHDLQGNQFHILIVIDAHQFHINTVSIRPHVMSVVLDSLSKRIGNLVKPDELAHFLHLRVISGGSRVQPRYDGSYISKYGGVK